MKLTTPSLALLSAFAMASPATAQIGATFCSGAVNSTGSPSAITAAGSTVVNVNDLTLSVSGLPQNVLGYFITSTTPGFVGNAGGSSGNLCVVGSVGRYAGNVLSSGGGGAVTFPIDLTSMPAPMGSVAVLPGDAWFFQFWHRDASPMGATSNFSPGLAVDFAPAVPTFSQDVWPILATTNIGAPACIICHGSNGPGGLTLGFTAQMGFSALVNVPSTSPNCGGSLYVVPGDPSASLMFDKLTNTTPACGVQMPFGGALAGDINIIREWILTGAAF